MISKKSRAKDRISPSRYFQELKTGDGVAIIRKKSAESKFPLRLQGRTGHVEGRRGGFYIVSVRDQEKEKKFLISPIHLKKIN